MCQLKGQTEPWGDWHVELPTSFQIQFPGQHCGLLCVSEKQGPRPQMPGAGRASGGRKGQLIRTQMCSMGQTLALEALTGLEAGEPTLLCPGAVSTEHRRPLGGRAEGREAK